MSLVNAKHSELFNKHRLSKSLHFHNPSSNSGPKGLDHHRGGKACHEPLRFWAPVAISERGNLETLEIGFGDVGVYSISGGFGSTDRVVHLQSNVSFPALPFYEIQEEELEKLLGDSSWKYEKDRVENMAKPKHSVTPITTKRD